MPGKYVQATFKQSSGMYRLGKVLKVPSQSIQLWFKDHSQFKKF